MLKEKDIELVIEKLMKLYGNDVLRIAYLYLKDYQLAEDAFQEVFLKVFHNYDSFRNDSSSKTWLISITINVCKDMLRKNWLKRVETVEDDYLNQIKAEEDSLDQVTKKELFQSILLLDDKYKDVIILYYYQGYKINEIADILDCTSGQVSSLLARGRKRLKEILESARWFDE